MMMLFLLTSPVRGDSLNWETVKLIINSQHNFAMYGIAIVTVIVAALMIGSWIWHIRLSRRDIENAIKSFKSEITAEVEEFKKHTQELDKKLEDNSKKMDEKMQLMDKKMAKFDADQSRVFAVVSQQSESFGTAAYRWAEAIKGYTNPKVDDENHTRISVDHLIYNLEKCISENIKIANYMKKIEEALPHIPETLDEKKKRIEGLLKVIDEKMAKSDADQTKASARKSEQRKDFSTAAGWWATAIKGYTNPKVDDKRHTTISVNRLIQNLKRCISENIQLGDFQREKIKEALPHIPKTLDEKKKEIIEGLLEKLPYE